MIAVRLTFLLCLHGISISPVDGFQHSFSFTQSLPHKKLTACSMGFFDDLLKDAFANDPNLSKDGVQGSIEGPADDSNSIFAQRQTEVQKRWLEAQEL